MNFNFRRASHMLGRQFAKHAWTTSRQKWITSCGALGLLVGTICVPPFGLAAFGGAIAGWWFAVALIATFGGLVGGHMDTRNELAALKRQAKRDKYQ